MKEPTIRAAMRDAKLRVPVPGRMPPPCPAAVCLQTAVEARKRLRILLPGSGAAPALPAGRLRRANRA